MIAACDALAIGWMDAVDEVCERQALGGRVLGDAEEPGQRAQHDGARSLSISRSKTANPPGRQRDAKPVLGHEETLLAAHHLARGLAAHARHLDIGRYPGQQLAGGERLDQIVVGAGVQPLDLGLLAGPRRQQDHRRAGQGCLAADRAQQVEPVQPRHHHIGQDQVRALPRAAASATSPSPTALTA